MCDGPMAHAGARKRKLDEDGQECDKLYTGLTAALEKRVQDVDAYVATKLQELETHEAKGRENGQNQLASIQEREAAVGRREAEVGIKAAELQQREQAIDAKSAELQGLHTQLIALYNRLCSQLPELQARTKQPEGSRQRKRDASAAVLDDESPCNLKHRRSSSKPQSSQQQISAGAHSQDEREEGEQSPMDVDETPETEPAAAAAARISERIAQELKGGVWQNALHGSEAALGMGGSAGLPSGQEGANMAQSSHAPASERMQPQRKTLQGEGTSQKARRAGTSERLSAPVGIDMHASAAPAKHCNIESQPAAPDADAAVPPQQGIGPQSHFKPVVHKRQAVPAEGAPLQATGHAGLPQTMPYNQGRDRNGPLTQQHADGPGTGTAHAGLHKTLTGSPERHRKRPWLQDFPVGPGPGTGRGHTGLASIQTKKQAHQRNRPAAQWSPAGPGTGRGVPHQAPGTRPVGRFGGRLAGDLRHRLGRPTGDDFTKGEIHELDGLVSSLRAQRPPSAEQTQEGVPEADVASPLGPEQVQSGIPEAEAAAPGSVPDLAEASAEAPSAQVGAPDLVSRLQAEHTLSISSLADAGSNGNAATHAALYNQACCLHITPVHQILGRCMGSQPSGAVSDSKPGQAAEPEEAMPAAGSSPVHRLCADYKVPALEILMEAAKQYSDNREPVTFGWCKELEAFVFVFEAGNRIVLEKPKYRHATYFFEIEEPLPISCQVQRLIAVLSVPSIGRSALLQDAALRLPKELPEQDMAVLRQAGWTEEKGLRALLNFSGERVLHYKDTGAIATDGEAWERYRKQLRQVLSQGRANGRVYKPSGHKP